MSGVGWFSQLRRDRALRGLPLWILVTAFNTSFLAGLLVWRAHARTGRGGLGWTVETGVDRYNPESALYLVIWLSIALYLSFGRVRARCRQLDLGLPLAACRLWLSHTVAICLSGAVLAAASLGVVALQFRLLARGVDPALPLTQLPPLAAHLGASLLLAVAVLHGRRPGLWKVPVDRGYVVLLLATLVTVPALALVVGVRNLAGAALPLALAGGIAWWTYRSLPAGFTLVPLAPGAARKSFAADRPARAVGGERPPATSARRVLRLVASTVNTTPPWGPATPWVLYPLTALLGAILAGAIEIWTDLPELKYLYLPLVAYLLFANIAPLTHQLHRLDPLPVSRRILFAILVLPGLAAVALGYGAGRVLLATFAERTSPVEYRIRDTQRWVSVPPRFMKIAWNGDPPRLSAPWGEEHAAWKDQPVSASRIAVYSPFNTPEESSAAFEALLTSRAIAAVYGESISPEEILSRYFVVEGDRLVGLAKGRLTLAKDYPELRPLPEGPVFLPLVLLAVLPALIAIGLFFRTFRCSVGERGRLGFFWGAVIFLVVLMLSEVMAPMIGWVSPLALIGLIEIPLQKLGESASGWLAALVAAGLSTAAAYLFAQAQFLRTELPAKPTRFGLQVGWSGQ